MIAWAGLERLRLGQSDALDFAPRPRWPLDPDAAPAVGAGHDEVLVGVARQLARLDLEPVSLPYELLSLDDVHGGVSGP